LAQQVTGLHHQSSGPLSHDLITLGYLVTCLQVLSLAHHKQDAGCIPLLGGAVVSGFRKKTVFYKPNPLDFWGFIGFSDFLLERAVEKPVG